MQKSGLYSREGILMRGQKRTVDKNHTYQQKEWSDQKSKDSHKHLLRQNYHNFRRVSHFGTREERKQLQTEVAQDMFHQLTLKQQKAEAQAARERALDEKNARLLARELEKDRAREVERRKNLTKIAWENKTEAYFKKNTVYAHNQHRRHEAGKAERFITKMPEYPYDQQALIR